ncbi:GrdX family protein [Aerococcus sp. UMB7834]|uniref:GrdX family protein n=1 Tax=Aerococcus sp. UMB7834 TaxID=3046342 RepID=UPI002550631E|nr:GrdX family protein [Aerococcus sp. UMB7834]MDK6805309.1 GrdX family protein [Aerococcus sp. UMB7834]
MQIITNNPQVKEKISAPSLRVRFVDGEYRDVLEKAREVVVDDKVSLLTHPLSSSLKPNETFYKSIALTDKAKAAIDLESLEMMENAISVYDKFSAQEKRPDWNEATLRDFSLIDLDLIQHALERMQIPPHFM